MNPSAAPSHTPSQPSVEATSEYLRMVIPLLGRHGIPATPENYTVWYTHVSGGNTELSAEIDQLVADGTAFTPEICDMLYQRHLLSSRMRDLEQVRTTLDTLLQDVSRSLVGAGSDAENYSASLDNAVVSLAQQDDATRLSNLLTALIDETRGMKLTTAKMQSDFEHKTREIEILQEQLKQERQRALTDPLTGLANRIAVLEELERAVEADDGLPASLIMIDIDHFKTVNDSHGHLIGDRVIRFVAQTITRNVKGRDTAARYGGEEFVVLLPGTDVRGAQAVAESIRHAIAQARLVRTETKQSLGQITVSAGIAKRRQEEAITDWINRADKALYQAKNKGRNRVELAQ
jgi:diguanylate cyclase